MAENIVETLRGLLKAHPDFPKPGIVFQDIFPIFQNPQVMQKTVAHLQQHIITNLPKIDVIVGLDARGFLLGPWLAAMIGAAFVPVRKRGKLPGKCHQAEYEKEYGVDIFEIQQDAIKEGQTVVVIDDLIATGGSARAAGELIDKCKGVTKQYIFFVELDFLNGSSKLNAPVYSLMHFE
jgi:adenine phosphoribosyltransferase